MKSRHHFKYADAFDMQDEVFKETVLFFPCRITNLTMRT